MTHLHKVDLLAARHGRRRARGRGTAGPVLRTAVAVALAILAISVPFVYSAGAVAVGAARGRSALLEAQASAERLDFAAAGRAADRAHDSFLGAEERMSALKLFSFLPPLADPIAALDGLLSSGTAGSAAASDLFAIGADVMAALDESRGLVGAIGPLPDRATLIGDLSDEERRRILTALAAGGPRFAAAAEQTERALAAFDSIPTSQLQGRLGEIVVPLRTKLAAAHEVLSAVAPVAAVAPSLMGHPEPKRYLFFFQNDTELRPTGGFLGVYGAFTVRDGAVTDLRTDDIYALDGPAERSPRPAPPAPIAKYLGVSKWYLRDANWSPDFQESAKLMERFYREEAAIAGGGAVPPVDGIVAITTRFAEDVLRLVGPIEVDGKTFTAENLVDELQYQVEQGFVRDGVPYAERKGVVGDLVEKTMARLMALPISRIADAADVAMANLREGHILLYSKDPTLAAEIAARDWGGTLRPVAGDYLMYVDANLAALKTDQAVERSIRYAVTPAAGSAYEGRLTMTYKNTGSFTWKTTRYRTYARLYVPAGTELIEVRGAMENDKVKDPARRPGKADTYDELGRRAFGAFVSVEPGETRTLEFRFRLAPSVIADIKAGKYALYVEKQPGTAAHGLTLDLDIGKKLTDAKPAEDRKEWGDARYRMSTDLRTDRTFEVEF